MRGTTEENNVLLRGISYAPDDLQSVDGDMSICHNLVYEHGALRPLVFSRPEMTLRYGENLIYIDTIHTNKHYMVLINDRYVGAFRMEDGARKDFDLHFSLKEGEKLNSVQSIGNILMFYTTDGCHYAVWKENKYTYLGDGLPEIPVSFGLRGTVRRGEKFELKDFAYVNQTNLIWKFAENDRSRLNDVVMSHWNKYVNETGTEQNRFLQPFFVRYALRLTDGSLVRHSAPVLMLPTTTVNPSVHATTISSGDVLMRADCHLFGIVCQLDYRAVLGDSILKELQRWDGVIEGIEIYASLPIYQFDTSKPIEGIEQSGMLKSNYLGKLLTEGDWKEDSFGKKHSAQVEKHYQNWDYDSVYDLTQKKEVTQGSNQCVLFPMYNGEEKNEKLESASIFYKIASVPLKDLSNVRSVVEIGEGVLKNLSLQPRMTDEYRSHDTLMSNYVYTYNQRVHLSGISIHPFSGFMLDELVCYTENSMARISGSNSIEEIKVHYCGNSEMRVSFQENGITYTVGRKGYDEYAMSNIHYLYYPNPRCKGAYLTLTPGEGEPTRIAYTMREHPRLNGSYWYGSDKRANDPNELFPSVATDIRISQPNKIYVSEVWQPLHFPLSGVQTVGTGQIRGISSVTSPLSEGQFGQFPLLVFSSDGVWAMEVNPNTGLYTSSTPISRDICVNPSSLIQTNGAIYFITDRGVMVVDGRTVSCVSNPLDGIPFYPDSVHMLPYMLQRENLPELSDPFSLKEFLLACKTSYDYANERLLFYSDRYRTGLLYQMSTGMWSTFSSDFINGISDYPNSYLIRKDRSVVHLSEKRDFQNGSPAKCLFVTRPLKLGDVGYKTVNRILVRGGLRGKFGMMLFGSFDGISYVPMGSVKGTSLNGIEGSPMKYFRVAFAREMTVQEYIASLSVYSQRRWREIPR